MGYWQFKKMKSVDATQAAKITESIIVRLLKGASIIENLLIIIMTTPMANYQKNVMKF